MNIKHGPLANTFLISIISYASRLTKDLENRFEHLIRGQNKAGKSDIARKVSSPSDWKIPKTLCSRKNLSFCRTFKTLLMMYMVKIVVKNV